MLPMPVKYTKMHYSSSKEEEMKLTGHGIQSFYLPILMIEAANCQEY